MSLPVPVHTLARLRTAGRQTMIPSLPMFETSLPINERAWQEFALPPMIPHSVRGSGNRFGYVFRTVISRECHSRASLHSVNTGALRWHWPPRPLPVCWYVQKPPCNAQLQRGLCRNQRRFCTLIRRPPASARNPRQHTFALALPPPDFLSAR